MPTPEVGGLGTTAPGCRVFGVCKGVAGLKEEVCDDDVRLEDDWVPVDESLAPHELDQVIRSKEACSRAVVLECIGDIPDADTKPPENQLFVCRLNPITEEEDLHTVFSRFGAINSVTIVRNRNGGSVGFAFIEFESKVACEQAYYAMDGSLIDDRRIRIDLVKVLIKNGINLG
uniref:peptidylprolyl isomerase n=1 Tax=Chenopodium quinoa TaxID=63459 RepID=A0A803N2Q7_CHEQI